MRNIDWDKAHKIFQRDKEDIFELLKKESEKHPRIRDVLLVLAAGTFISAAVIMPGLPIVLKPFIWQGDGFKNCREMANAKLKLRNLKYCTGGAGNGSSARRPTEGPRTEGPVPVTGPVRHLRASKLFHFDR